MNAHPTLREGRELPAKVFACLVRDEIRIVILPGVGLANGGAPQDIPLELVAPELRTPNTPIWVQLDETMKVIRAWKREPNGDE